MIAKMVKREDSWSGKHLREMFRAGTKLLNNSSTAVNALNVFPVPDGDTGTNMLLTMQSAMAEANFCPDNDASAVAHAMANGALMGARGNSGVILSQVLRGLAQGLDAKKTFTGMDIARALGKASTAAYGAMSQPTEGTMLTVIREAAEVAQATSYAGYCDLLSILEAAVGEAKDSVARTPDLLPVLKESGVVDAGGYGLALVLEGLLRYVHGDEVGKDDPLPDPQTVAVVTRVSESRLAYGYCTEFLLQGSGLDVNAIRKDLDEMGTSVMVVGDETTVRVHIHTSGPGGVIAYGTAKGILKQIKIDNMQEQHQEFVAAQMGNISIVAVASGEGLVAVFGSLGATQVIPGGETMNPSVQQLFEAVESVPTEEVILLPNNPDILPTARQVVGLIQKKLEVVPTRTIPQGIAALMAFNHENDLEANVSSMTEGLKSVSTGQIATAIRSMRYRNMRVAKGQIVGFIDGELTVAEYTIENALAKLLGQMNALNSEIMTVYYGNKVDWADAERMLEAIRPLYPGLEIEVVYGGQPHYDYLISVE